MSASDPIAGDTIMPGSPLDEAIKWKLALMQRGDFQYASDLSALARILNGADHT
jgi:hypothetical protein